MEARRLLSTINWVNKGTGPGVNDTDSFNAVFGANATLARSIVQRGIDDWERVITNFNGFAGRNTYTLNVDAGFLGANTSADTNVTSYDGLLKPQAATITMDDNAAGGTGGWYFDATPGTATVPDDSDFTTFITPFAADRNGTQGRDFYRSFIHELTHAMGLSATATRITGSEVDAGDDPNSVDPADRLKTIDIDSNGTPDYTFTTSGGRHLFEGGGGYAGPVHPNEIINPGRVISTTNVRRGLISDVVANCVSDIFDYTITVPSFLNTFYVNLNTAFNSVTVTGDMNFNNDDTDVIDLEVAGTAMSFEVNGTDEVIEGAQFGAIIVNSGLAADDVDVDQLLSGKSVDINMGDGNDEVTIAAQFGDIDTDLQSDVDLDGGTGTDTIDFNDSSDGPGSDTYAITSPAVQKGARIINHLLFEHVVFLLGSPNPSTYNINSTSPFYDVDLLGGNTTDTFNVGNGDYDSSIFGDIHIDGYIGADVLNINDDTDTGAGTYTLNSISFSKSSGGGLLTYDSMGSVIVNGSGQASTYNVDINLPRSPVTINAGAGNDVLDVDGAGNDIDSAVWMPITFNGQNGNDLLELNDTGDAADNESYTIDTGSFSKSSGTFTSLTFNGTERLNLTGNGGANTINVNEIESGMHVTLNGGTGNDAFVNPDLNINAHILGDVTLDGGGGTDTITLDDSNGATATEYRLDSNTFQVTQGVLSGVINYSNAEVFAFTANPFDTDIEVWGTTVNTDYTLRGNDGADQFNVGGPSNNADYIDGDLTVIGGPGSDYVKYGDNGHNADAQYTVSATQVFRAGTPAVNYTAEQLRVDAGAENDTIAVQSTSASISTDVYGDEGNDTITIATGSWDTAIQNPVQIFGLTGIDSVTINDSTDSGADAYTMTSGQTTKSVAGTGSIGYSGVESLTLNANVGANAITVSSTFDGDVQINGGNGADTFDVASTFAGRFVTIDGAAGLDNVNVNQDAVGTARAKFVNAQDLAALHVFTGGTMSAQAGGAVLTYTRSITIDATGVLDLNDNDMIIDYTGLTPITTIAGLISTARNGGAWNGTTGITSTVAKNAVPRNTTLGTLEGSMFKSIYGAAATFDGQPIDNTSVLVKYTYYGDTDFNGVVDFDDYSRTDSGFNLGRSGWINGDFDGNGLVDFDDYSLIDLAFNTQGAVLRPAGSAPKPGGLPGRGGKALM